MKSTGVLCLCAILLTVSVASGQKFIMYSSYTDSNCNNPSGAYYTLYTSDCTGNAYVNCTAVNGLYAKGECLDNNPMVPLPEGFASMYIYDSNDETCSPPPYWNAFAAPLDACFLGISDGIYKLTGCEQDNQLTFTLYSTVADCETSSNVVVSLSQLNGSCVGYNSDYQTFCPFPIPPPVAPVTPPMAAPMDGPSSGSSSTPSSSPSSGPSSNTPSSAPGQSPSQTPAKKSSASLVAMSFGVSAVLLYLLA